MRPVNLTSAKPRSAGHPCTFSRHGELSLGRLGQRLSCTRRASRARSTRSSGSASCAGSGALGRRIVGRCSPASRSKGRRAVQQDVCHARAPSTPGLDALGRAEEAQGAVRELASPASTPTPPVTSSGRTTRRVMRRPPGTAHRGVAGLRSCPRGRGELGSPRGLGGRAVVPGGPPFRPYRAWSGPRSGSPDDLPRCARSTSRTSATRPSRPLLLRTPARCRWVTSASTSSSTRRASRAPSTRCSGSGTSSSRAAPVGPSGDAGPHHAQGDSRDRSVEHRDVRESLRARGAHRGGSKGCVHAPRQVRNAT